MSTTVTIQERTGDTMLCLYPRQDHPQPCYLELNLRTGHLSADYSGEIGNAVPIEVWNGLVRRYPVQPLRNDTVNALMHEIVPLAQQVLAGADIRWNGNDHVGVLDDAATKAERAIGRLTETYEGDIYWVFAVDWLSDTEDELLARLSAGESVEDLAEELDGDGNDADHPIIVNIRQYLKNLAD